MALSADTNPNYIAFLPSVVDHWKANGLEPVVALVAGTNENVDILVATIRAFAEVRVLRVADDPRLPQGHVAKLARACLATQFGNDVVTIVDIDYCLIWFKQWSVHLACVPENGVLGLGHNRHEGAKDSGKFPMHLTTARSSAFARFLNPHESFKTWLATFRNVKVFDNSESPHGAFGSFSDESLFRVLLSKSLVPVVWVNTPATWKRIDRAQRHAVGTAELAAAADVFPNRPFDDCHTHAKRLQAAHRFLKIERVQRDVWFVDTLIGLGLRERDWGKAQCHAMLSLRNCTLVTDRQQRAHTWLGHPLWGRLW